MVLALSLVSTTATLRAEGVLRLPGGFWIGPPVPLETRVKVLKGPLDYREPPFEAVLSEDKTLTRRLFELLPPEVQKLVTSPPPSPAIQTVSSYTDHLMVFPAGGGITLDVIEQFHFAFADETGVAGAFPGRYGSRQLNLFAGEWLYSDACIPRRCREVTMMAWEIPKGESRADCTQAPVATVKFRNPFFNLPAVPRWPDGKVQHVAKWHDAEFTLVKATRKRSPDNLGATLSVSFRIEGQWAERDFERVQAVFEDSGGNRFFSDSWSYGRHTDGYLTWSESPPHQVLWPENPNLKVSFYLSPRNRFALAEGCFQRVRIPIQPGWTTVTAPNPPFVLDGMTIQSIRLRKTEDRAPHKRSQLMLKRYDHALLEVEVAGPVLHRDLQIFELGDGRIPLNDRAVYSVSEVSTLSVDSGFSIGIDKRSTFLEFTVTSAVPEKLDFYCQPEFVP